MDEELQELIKLCKDKEKDSAGRFVLLILSLPPSSLKGDLAKFKNVANYEKKREEAKEKIKNMGGFENASKEYDKIESELAEIKSQLAEYIEEYPSEELRVMVSEDNYEWLVTKEEDIKKYLKGVEG